KGDVVGTAHSRFQHAATPNGNLIFLTKIVNAFGFAKPSDSTEFDIDDLAGAQCDGGFGLLVRMDALVKADRSFQGFLDFDVAVQIVPAERLFDHHEVVGIHLFQKVDIFATICGVGVNGQSDAGEFLAEALYEE